MFLIKGKKRKTEDEAYSQLVDDNDSVDFSEGDGVPGAASKNAETNDDGIMTDEYGAKDYRTQMELKVDHGNRPL